MEKKVQEEKEAMSMGGKGSGRHKKPLSLVIEEVQDELLELDDLMHIDKDEAHLRINRLIARLSYHWEKLKKIEEYRRRMKRLRNR